MRRFALLCAAAAAASAFVGAAGARAPAHAGYYVIRWQNTGVCQIWNEELKFKPIEWPSTYKVVSRPAPTFAAAAAVQEKMRQQHRCTL